jgi:hypothetical protein
MAKLVYQLTADNLAASGTITPSTEDSIYPIENLYDSNPAKPMRFTSTTGNIVWNFGSATQVDFIAIIHHNLTPGLEVRFQGNATDSWSSPSLNQLLTVPADDLDNYPNNIYEDITDLSPRTYQYWRLVVVGTNAANVALGEVWISNQIRTLDDVDIKYPVEEQNEHPIIEHKTDYKVSTIYDLGIKIRRFSAEAQSLNTTQTAAIRTWWDSTRGRVRPFIVVPDSDAPDVYGAMLVRFTEIIHVDRHVFPNITDVRLSFEEVSRGLYL